jgi:hypothetical protein
MGNKVNKQVVKATIYNTSVKTKAEIRAESDKALKAFLKKGGVVEVGRPARNRKSSMLGKNSRGFIGGTSGFATGYPRRSIGA